MILIQTIMDSDSRRPGFVIEFECQNGDWSLPENSVFEEIASKTLLLAKWNRKCFISVLFTDDAHIKDLNREYRGYDKPTNVLSFPGYDEELLAVLPSTENVPLGDIILAFETIRDEAISQNKPFEHHVKHLFVHGLLHLLGFDHEIETDAAVMEHLEIDILSFLSIPNPYEVIEIL